jgi:hypothetical protein
MMSYGSSKQREDTQQSICYVVKRTCGGISGEGQALHNWSAVQIIYCCGWNAGAAPSSLPPL